MIAFVAALAAGGSDTIASEIGKAWGRRTFLFPSFRRVAPGTSGAISLEGTAAGICRRARACRRWGGARPHPRTRDSAGRRRGDDGAFAESVLGATLEGRRILNNDVLNFLNTAIAADLAIRLAARRWRPPSRRSPITAPRSCIPAIRARIAALQRKYGMGKRDAGGCPTTERQEHLAEQPQFEWDAAI